tara:strand:- start:803 stop:997 length:195 start_codon:yes stop_codon:yes gene_type:complete
VRFVFCYHEKDEMTRTVCVVGTLVLLIVGRANSATQSIKRVITGAVILVAVLLDAARQRWKRRG